MLPRTLKAFTNEVRALIFANKRISFASAVHKVLFEVRNVRDAFEHEVLSCEIYFKLYGERRKPTMKPSDAIVIQWVRVLHKYDPGVPMMDSMNATFDQFGYENFSPERRRLYKIVGRELGPRGSRVRKKMERKKFQDEHQGNLPLPINLPSVPR